MDIHTASPVLRAHGFGAKAFSGARSGFSVSTFSGSCSSSKVRRSDEQQQERLQDENVAERPSMLESRRNAKGKMMDGSRLDAERSQSKHAQHVGIDTKTTELQTNTPSAPSCHHYKMLKPQFRKKRQVDSVLGRRASEYLFQGCHPQPYKPSSS